MPRWMLHTLGTPRLVGADDAPPVRFRYRDTWLLLASLATDPATDRRAALAVRLGLDRNPGGNDPESGRDKLRIRLSDLRHGESVARSRNRGFGGIGPDCLHTDRDLVALADGAVRTDLEELASCLSDAARCASLPERLARLKQGAALLRGPFLDGFEAPDGTDSWLVGMRFQVDRLTAELWLRLAEALDGNGERRDAFDAARKAYTLAPENPAALELLIELAEGQAEKEAIRALSGPLESVVDRNLESDPLTIPEENALRRAVESRLTQLSERVVRGLEIAALFPDAFTVEQAEEVAELSAETLNRIAASFPLGRDGNRFQVPPAVAPILRSRVPSDVAERFRERHACALLPIFHDCSVVELRNRCLRSRRHLLSAIDWRRSRPFTSPGISLLVHCWNQLKGDHEVRAALLACIPQLETEFPGLVGHDAYSAANLLAHMEFSRGEFARAHHWFRVVEGFDPPQVHHWEYLILSAHHAVDDAAVDHYADLILNHWPVKGPLPEVERILFLASVHQLVAENAVARQRYPAALEANDNAFALRRELGHEDTDLAVLWGQRATILGAMGGDADAEACWDQALAGYQANGNPGGIAECFREIGRLAAQRGRFGLAVSLQHQAIAAYEASGEDAAAAATRGVLGDILCQQGRFAEARAQFEMGLHFWKARNHPRWIQRFEERIDRIK